MASNPAMPNYTKIGMTKDWPEKRLSALWTTGVPLPFKLEYAAQVTDRRLAESFLHDSFAHCRVEAVNPKTGRRVEREFFNIDPEVAVGIAKKNLGNSLKIKAYKAKRKVGVTKWRKGRVWVIALMTLAALWATGAVDYLWLLAVRVF